MAKLLSENNRMCTLLFVWTPATLKLLTHFSISFFFESRHPPLFKMKMTHLLPKRFKGEDTLLLQFFWPLSLLGQIEFWPYFVRGRKVTQLYGTACNA